MRKILLSKIGLLSVVGFLFSCLYSCGGRDAGPAILSYSISDSINAVCIPMYKKGDYDSVIIIIRPLFQRAVLSGDTLEVLVRGAHVAQSYQHKENADSVKWYLDKITGFMPAGGFDSEKESIVHFIRGDYELKSELDYAEALKYYKMGYDNSRKFNDVHGIAVALFDMVYIFYIRSDEYGMKYARELYELSKIEGVDVFTRYYAYMAMAQMHYVSANMTQAYAFVSAADSIAASNNISIYNAMTSLISGDICNSEGQYPKADSCYMAALDDSFRNEFRIIPLIYLNYAKMCESRRDYDKAISLLKKGIDATHAYNNIEVRRKLLHRLAGLYYNKKKDRDSAAYYMCLTLADSSYAGTDEQKFSNLLFQYQQMEYDYHLQSKELELIRANHRIEWALFILILIATLSVSSYVLYDRKRKMYKALVIQYQSLVQKQHANKELSEEKQESLRVLFDRIEKLMEDERLYRRNDLSVNVLAELLDTNRTYVSKAINTFREVSFNGYLNRYRIMEAVKIISEKGEEVLFKQLADDLGFNSSTVFASAFLSETGCTPTRYRKILASAAKRNR